ncbi:MAG: hypothetical protein WCO00_02075 [Rhodospirillaceae bacterium]
MKSKSGFLALGALVALLVLSGPVRAATGAAGGTMVLAEESAPADQPPAIRAMTDGEKAAAGCVISTVATMGTVYAIGPSEFIMVVVGGLIVPSSSPVLFVGLLGTIASMACGAGAAITPAVLWFGRQFGDQGGRQAAAPAADPVRKSFARLGSGLSRVAAGLGGRDLLVAEAPAAE